MGSTLIGGHVPVGTRLPLTRSPCSSARTPVTSVVWLGQVTVGLMVVMRAVTPCRIRRRRVGTGSLASSSAQAGKPFNVITITMRGSGGVWAAAGPHNVAPASIVSTSFIAILLLIRCSSFSSVAQRSAGARARGARADEGAINHHRLRPRSLVALPRQALGHQQERELKRVVGGVHPGRGFGGPGGLAHPTEGDAGERNQQHVAPGFAVLVKMEQAEGQRGGQNAGNGAQTANQQRLQESAEYEFFPYRGHDASEDRHQDQ